MEKYPETGVRPWNTGFFRNPQCLWKTLSWFLPGQDFMTNKFLPAGVTARWPLLISMARCPLTASLRFGFGARDR